MAAEPERGPLPFEPKRKRKKAADQPAPARGQKAASRPQSFRNRPDTQIPEVVSRRMLKRMLVFSGIPTSLGVAAFFLSYFLLVRHIAELPNVAVFLTTLGCFGLGVLGLSYGALSASWDEQAPGELLGIQEFRDNFGRLTQAWRDSRKARQSRTDKES
ncbi:MAG: DUF3464 family protein [Leptolyngbya sp. RL_3_1]|nr:DUF3464 family protein [Leptolyngbya sp. RL_3_1]